MVKCDEALRAVTLSQTVPGQTKQHTTRTYHFDKARTRLVQQQQAAQRRHDRAA